MAGKSKPPPRWKQPPKTKEERSSKFKERQAKKKDPSKEKHVRASQDPAWLALKEWAWQIRRETYLSCGYDEKDIPPLFSRSDTNYYDESRHNKDVKTPARTPNRNGRDRKNSKRR